MPDEHPSTVEEMESHEAARLFAARASYRRRDFALTSENAHDVATICRRLDGIPLALELAAARVGPLSVGQIAHRLDDSLVLLTGGSRTTVSRHRTLRATLDWSHELLGEDEKELFGRLSVFAGGWTLEAAEAVGAGGSTGEDDILDPLSSLVEKSLVVSEAVEVGGVRYRMLEPVRQYAQEKLEESREAEDVRRRHLTFFLVLAEDAEPRLQGPEDMVWLQRLEAEQDNLRAALSWSLERGETKLGLRLAGTLGLFWHAHGHLGEGRKWLEEALAKGDWASVAERLKAMKALFWLAFDQWDHDRAEAVAQEAIELSVEADINSSLAASLRVMLAGPAWVGGITSGGRSYSKRASRSAGRPMTRP